MSLLKGLVSNRIGKRDHPFTEHPKHTYFQICEKVCDFYGVTDAERWFACHTKDIRNRCLPDPFGLTQHASMREFWEIRQMEAKYTEGYGSNGRNGAEQPAKHTVEIYRVRAPGSNGEIGVLTTTHDVDEFVSGLAIATAKHLKDNPGDVESAMRWIFKNAMPIAFKLAGYKAEQVVERHVLMCGSGAPSADDIIASA